MRIAVIGAGRMGAGFAKLLTGRHEVVVGSRDPDRGREVARELGAARGGGYGEAAADAEVLFLTVPWTSVEETIGALGDLSGKILVDVSNPYVDGKLRPHEDTSDAEEIQRLAPGARVVKGWNTIFQQVLNGSPDFDGQAASVFLAGDDEEAKAAVAGLAREMGFDPVDTGPLSSARKLERLVSMLGTLGHGLEWGTYTLKLLRR